jgi:hypothetical protein
MLVPEGEATTGLAERFEDPVSMALLFTTN